ncbi:AAA family ATPase [Nocardioides alpinus]|uniref:AAA family ATPase n=1 Tax=Nocardioides alpinus TaxID=748909 RepID=UPI001E57C1A3|nr:AAA family ATPase [Nocardioides alpinus]
MRNFLVEGVSGTGKTSVCHELRRRGHHAVNGDTELAFQGDPESGQPTAGEPSHWHHLWREDDVRSLAADHTHRVTFFCGGSRNVARFVDVFDGVFVLTVDAGTLGARLDARDEDEFGGRAEERALVLRLHATGEDTPDGIVVDATAPLDAVVDEILVVADALG